MEYIVTITASIEASSDQEAFDKYFAGEYLIDDHKLERWVNGFPVEVDESELLGNY